MLVDLKEFSMAEILDIAEKSRSDLVTLRMTDPHLFMVYGDGHVIYASYRKLLGEEAFLSALLLDEGVVEITHLSLDIRIRPNITYVYDELLQEGSKRVDSYRNPRRWAKETRQRRCAGIALYWCHCTRRCSTRSDRRSCP